MPNPSEAQILHMEPDMPRHYVLFDYVQGRVDWEVKKAKEETNRLQQTEGVTVVNYRR